MAAQAESVAPAPAATAESPAAPAPAAAAAPAAPSAAPTPTPAARRAQGAAPARGSDDALDLGKTVLPILVKSYWKQAVAGVAIIGVIIWIVTR